MLLLLEELLPDVAYWLILREGKDRTADLTDSCCKPVFSHFFKHCLPENITDHVFVVFLIIYEDS